MNKNLMSISARLLAALNSLFHECERLTLNNVREKLGNDDGKLVIKGKLLAKPADLAPGDPPEVFLRSFGTQLNYGDWVLLRRYIDGVFVSDRSDNIPHVSGEVLLEAQNGAMLLRGALQGRMEDMEAKRQEAREYLEKAEEFYIPENRKPAGPLFGDAPMDVAPDLEELEEFETDPSRLLPPAVFTGPGEAVTSNGTTYAVKADGTAEPIDQQELGEVVDAEYTEVVDGVVNLAAELEELDQVGGGV